MKLYLAGNFMWMRKEEIELEQLRKMLKNGNCRRLASFFYYNPDKPREDYSGNVIRVIKRLKEEMNESQFWQFMDLSNSLPEEGKLKENKIN
jgi:nucleoside 2-deoxyribosyltransferase